MVKMDQETINPQLWVERYADSMFRFALLRVNDDEHADDSVQNTFLAACSALAVDGMLNVVMHTINIMMRPAVR